MSTDADALVAEVLRLHHEGASIRRIARKLNLARMTVRAFLGARPTVGRRPRAFESCHDGVSETVMLSAEEETHLLLLGLSSELGLGYLSEIVAEVMAARAPRAVVCDNARRRHRRVRSR